MAETDSKAPTADPARAGTAPVDPTNLVPDVDAARMQDGAEAAADAAGAEGVGERTRSAARPRWRPRPGAGSATTKAADPPAIHVVPVSMIRIQRCFSRVGSGIGHRPDTMPVDGDSLMIHGPTKPARARVGKMTGVDLLVLAAEIGGTVGACLAVHLWMV